MIVGFHAPGFQNRWWPPEQSATTTPRITEPAPRAEKPIQPILLEYRACTGYGLLITGNRCETASHFDSGAPVFGNQDAIAQGSCGRPTSGAEAACRTRVKRRKRRNALRDRRLNDLRQCCPFDPFN